MGNGTLSLEYTPTTEDFSSSVPRGQGRTSRTPFLAVFQNTSYVVHGNSYTAVMKYGDDVSGDYGTWRRWRIWKLASSEGFSPAGPPELDWANDNLSKKPNWMDIPGYEFAVTPDKWPNERHLLEFVVSVEKHPEIGALYFYVVVSTKKNQYRVEMSSAKDIPFETWTKELLKSKQPWAKPSGCMVKVDSHWKDA